MTNFLSNLRCLVEGDPISKSFKLPETVEPSTVEDLRTLIHHSKPVWFKDVEAEDLILWRVTIPFVSVDKLNRIALNKFCPIELRPTDKLSVVFKETPFENTIHIIVQRPPQGNAALPLSLCLMLVPWSSCND